MLIQGFWSSMKERGGVVVNVTSRGATLQEVAPGRAGFTGLPQAGPAYGASKAALDRMGNVIAQEGLAHRIAVITVEPGLVRTETIAGTLANAGVTNDELISPTVPGTAIAYLCTCDNPLHYTGRIISAPDLAAELDLVS
jgi:NAD(P)-dependent dehydrogenase (short-subunit alcohol dehydrogenase family)